MLTEIRNYQFKTDLFAAYEEWARTEVVPHLSRRLSVWGFWINAFEARASNGDVLTRPGFATATWIIRWKDIGHRNHMLAAVLASPEWKDIMSRVPGGASNYRCVEASFLPSNAAAA